MCREEEIQHLNDIISGLQADQAELMRAREENAKREKALCDQWKERAWYWEGRAKTLLELAYSTVESCDAIAKKDEDGR